MFWRIEQGDVRERLRALPAGCAQTCVTSPPYWGLRDYGDPGQLGLEPTPEAYVAALVEVFRMVRHALADDGTIWLNLGDSYATGAGGVGDCPGGGKQGENWKLRGAMTPPNRLKLPGLKPKDLVGIPWRVAFALQADGWYLRSDIIWSKPNPMPESVTDRPTKAHEYIFLLSKSARYYYDAGAIREPAVKVGTLAHLAGGSGKRAGSRDGLRRDEWMERKRAEYDGKHSEAAEQSAGRRMLLNVKAARDGGGAHDSPFGDDRNKRSVWHVATQPYPDAHFATYPEDLIQPCILAGSRVGDTVLDPFTGSGTTGAVAIRHQRNFIGCELKPEYVQLARTRIGAVAPLFAFEATA
jgi:DNA modification methylase